MTWTYSDPAGSDKDAVRFEIQDTNSASPLVQDEELEYVIGDENQVAAGSPTTITGATLYRPAARCLEALSRLFAAQADTEIGSLKTTYSSQAKTYAQRASELRIKAQALNAPFAGGISRSANENVRQDSDLIRPAFTRRMDDSPYTGSNRFGSENFGPPS